jgi:peptidyl-prolyl cis-trans isomerase C
MGTKKAHASHILVKSKAEAIQIKVLIKKAKDFEKFAMKKSSCPSGKKGGDLGWFEEGQMVPEFDETVWAIELNKCSQPIMTQFGHHLIWVHERK